MSLFLSVHFPERRIRIESANGSRSLTIGTREQLMGLASAAMLAGWLTVSAVTGAGNSSAQRTEAELNHMAAQVQALKADSAALRGTVAGMGGPYVPAAGDSDAADSAGADPRFAELFANWQRVEQLETAITSLPSFVPVRDYRLSSSFGVRHDPFNGKAASHTGLDMAGTRGQPIYAAAGGKVVRAGRFAGYGNCIDIDHGNGVITRYGHLATIGVKVGQKVAIGEKIAGMGSTGRSTGTHLHYEVRIDGRAVNPRPFIEASSYLLAFNNSEAAQ